MAVSHTQVENSTAILLETPTQQQEDQDDTQICQSIHHLETFLRFFGCCQYSLLSCIFFWIIFVLIGFVLPLFIIKNTFCSNCREYEVKSFEVEILVSRSLVAAIALACISHNLRKYGVRKFLFVDRYHGQVAEFREAYVQKINGFFRLIALCLLPCFLAKTAREVIRIIYVHPDSTWESVAIVVTLLVSWSYSTTIYVSASALFNLVCNLQVIHYENYWKFLERDLDVSVYIDEHIRLTYNLSRISHRFRIFLLIELLVVTGSQFVALLETTGHPGTINFINGGDFVVCSIAELVGIVICLHAATKITCRAQSLASVACRWHALVTCNNDDAPQHSGNLEGSLPMTFSQSDLESADYAALPANFHPV